MALYDKYQVYKGTNNRVNDQGQHHYQPQFYPNIPSSEPLNCIIDPNTQSGHTRGGLYVGNINSANNLSILEKNNIGAVLCVANQIHINYSNSSIKYSEIISVSDISSENLQRHFEKGTDWIADKLKLTNVLVHCAAGVSRSVTMTIAYLMKYQGYSFQKGLNLCRSRRSVANPNPGFVTQLKQYEQTLNKQNNQNKNNYGLAESLIYNRKSFIKDGHILGNKNLNNELSTSDLYKTADNKVKDFFERQKIAFADQNQQSRASKYDSSRPTSPKVNLRGISNSRPQTQYSNRLNDYHSPQKNQFSMYNSGYYGQNLYQSSRDMFQKPYGNPYRHGITETPSYLDNRNMLRNSLQPWNPRYGY